MHWQPKEYNIVCGLFKIRLIDFGLNEQDSRPEWSLGFAHGGGLNRLCFDSRKKAQRAARLFAWLWQSNPANLYHKPKTLAKKKCIN